MSGRAARDCGTGTRPCRGGTRPPPACSAARGYQTQGGARPFEEAEGTRHQGDERLGEAKQSDPLADIWRGNPG